MNRSKSRTRTNLPAAAALLAAAALGLGACGGEETTTQREGAGGQGVSAVGGQPMEDAMRALNRCLRRQGIDVPDPRPGEASEFDPRAAGVNPRRLAEAERRCASERRAIAEAAPRRSPEDLAEARDATLRFARCMREQGQDVPDPGVEGGGTAVEVPGGSKEDPAFQAAQRRCGGLLREADR